MVGLLKTVGGGLAGVAIRKLFSKKKKEEGEGGVKISDREATPEEVKAAAEKRRKKLQTGINANKNTSTIVGNNQTYGG
jgi:hypothetical protein